MEQTTPVLMLGGSGQAGAGAAALLRQWHPTLPLTIAARDLARARRVADELGTADAVTVDLGRRDLGLPEGHRASAVVATVWDAQLHGLRYAQAHGLPYLNISSALTDIAPEVVAGAQRPDAAAILLASHFCAGIAVHATRHWAREFERIDSIRIGAVLDESDIGGPAGMADLERWSAVTTAAHLRRDGVFMWMDGEEAQVKVTSVDGTVLAGQTIPILDVPSLALATDAPNVRFDLAVGESSGRRQGGPPTVELRVDLEGTDPTGAPRRTSRYLVHAAGQRPLTALGVALGVEGLLGLRGKPVRPGLHTPETVVDPDDAFNRLTEVGATVIEVSGE